MRANPFTASGQTTIQKVRGWSIRETSGLAGTNVTLREGSVSGPIAATVNVPASASKEMCLAETLTLGDDLYIQVGATGTISGVVWYDE